MSGRLGRFSPAGRDGAVELAEVVVALERMGSRSEASWGRSLAAGDAFERWLVDHGTTLETIKSLSGRGPHGLPQVPTALVVAFLADVVLHPHMKPLSAKDRCAALVRWFGGTGWSVEHLRRGGADHRLLWALVENHRYDDVDAHVKRVARPVTLEWSDRIVAEIDALRSVPVIAPLWVDAMRTFHLFVVHSGMRPGEAVCKTRWGWLNDVGSGFRMDAPGGVLKWLRDPTSVAIPSRPSDESLCPAQQLRSWRVACDAAGLPTGPDDLLFPAVRRFLDETQPKWWGDRLWIADPISDTLEGIDDDDARVRRALSAQKTHAVRYRKPWVQLAASAGFEPRHRFEKVVPQGLRRGLATTMRSNGAASKQIAHQLTQGSARMVFRYAEDLSGAVDPRPLYDIPALHRDAEEEWQQNGTSASNAAHADT